jgi:hypothetical protein
VSLADLKRGDAVIEVYRIGATREQHQISAVKSAGGSKWITTTSGRRYFLNGYGEFGWELHTAGTLEEQRRREAALQVIRNAISNGNATKPSLAALESAAAALRGTP